MPKQLPLSGRIAASDIGFGMDRPLAARVGLDEWSIRELAGRTTGQTVSETVSRTTNLSTSWMSAGVTRTSSYDYTTSWNTQVKAPGTPTPTRIAYSDLYGKAAYRMFPGVKTLRGPYFMGQDFGLAGYVTYNARRIMSGTPVSRTTTWTANAEASRTTSWTTSRTTSQTTYRTSSRTTSVTTSKILTEPLLGSTVWDNRHPFDAVAYDSGWIGASARGTTTVTVPDSVANGDMIAVFAVYGGWGQSNEQGAVYAYNAAGDMVLMLKEANGVITPPNKKLYSISVGGTAVQYGTFPRMNQSWGTKYFEFHKCLGIKTIRLVGASNGDNPTEFSSVRLLTRFDRNAMRASLGANDAYFLIKEDGAKYLGDTTTSWTTQVSVGPNGESLHERTTSITTTVDVVLSTSVSTSRLTTITTSWITRGLTSWGDDNSRYTDRTTSRATTRTTTFTTSWYTSRTSMRTTTFDVGNLGYTTSWETSWITSVTTTWTTYWTTSKTTNWITYPTTTVPTIASKTTSWLATVSASRSTMINTAVAVSRSTSKTTSWTTTFTTSTAIVTDYSNAGSINVTLPANAASVRAIQIGGGGAGSDGGHDGGDNGRAGNPGSMIDNTFNVTPGSTINLNIGVGGQVGGAGGGNTSITANGTVLTASGGVGIGTGNTPGSGSGAWYSTPTGGVSTDSSYANSFYTSLTGVRSGGYSYPNSGSLNGTDGKFGGAGGGGAGRRDGNSSGSNGRGGKGGNGFIRLYVYTLASRTTSVTTSYMTSWTSYRNTSFVTNWNTTKTTAVTTSWLTTKTTSIMKAMLEYNATYSGSWSILNSPLYGDISIGVNTEGQVCETATHVITALRGCANGYSQTKTVTYRLNALRGNTYEALKIGYTYTQAAC